MNRSRQFVLNKWEILNEIGRGKHGIVYQGRDDTDDTAVAIKIISLPNDDMKSFIANVYRDSPSDIDNYVWSVAEKFGNEVESMRKLNEVPNILRLYANRRSETEWIDSSGKPQRGYNIIMVMEYAVPLREYFSSRQLQIKDALNFACDISLGLAACEKRNIIHRDIKEDNLFIGFDGLGKVGDFGIASINETGLGTTCGMGTPLYMAPEVYNGSGNYDGTVDIYSLGIVLYKMLNGNRFPFMDGNAASTEEALKRRMSGERLPIPKYAGTELGNIILKCCEHSPQNRYQSGSELYNALKQAETKMGFSELERIVPYRFVGYGDTPIYDTPIHQGSESGEHIYGTYTDTGNKDTETASHTNGERSSGFKSVLMETVDVIKKLTQTSGAILSGLITSTTSAMRKKIEEVKRRRRLRNLVIFMSMLLAALTAVLIMLYPKTAIFYSDTSDNDRIHVKYLFLPDRRMTDAAASYLAVEGNWLYYSNPEEDHTMYKMSIWHGEPMAICSDDCEYNIVIGDYVYYSSYDEGEKLCRIRTDGSGKEYVINGACRDLRKSGNNIVFVLADTGTLMTLDTTTIGQQ